MYFCKEESRVHDSNDHTMKSPTAEERKRNHLEPAKKGYGHSMLFYCFLPFRSVIYSDDVIVFPHYEDTSSQIYLSWLLRWG